MSIDPTIELGVEGGAFVDVSRDVRQKRRITIARGRRDWAEVVDPAEGRATINNGRSNVAPAISGRYSPTNPLSDLFGRIGRNTPLRVSVSGSVRLAAEVSTWPPKWDLSDSDVQVPVRASGLLRRVQKGHRPLRSTLYEDLSVRDNLVVYWPLEGDRSDRRFPSEVEGDPAFFDPRITTEPRNGAGTALHATEVDLGSFDGFVGSDSLPEFPGDAGLIKGNAPGYEGAADQLAMCVLHIQGPSFAASTSVADYFEWFTTESGPGTIGHVRVRLDDDAQAFAEFTGAEFPGPIVAHTSATLPGSVLDRSILVYLRLEQVGADVDYEFGWVDEDGRAEATSDTIAGVVFNQFNAVRSEWSSNQVDPWSVGHIAVLNGGTDTSTDVPRDPFAAWLGERAADRITRIAARENLDLEIVGDADTTARLGRQTGTDPVAVMREAGTADLGFFGEQRAEVGLKYRARTSFYNQVPALVLNYADGLISEPFHPVEDDQHLVNDVTVSRTGGGSYHASDDTGPLSTLSPPDGVGRYSKSFTLSLASDAQLVDQAGWRLHLGTTEQLRFPSVTLDLHNPRVAAIAATVLALDEGDRIQIVNTPAWLPPGPVDLIVQGSEETIGEFTHTIELQCTPAGPWTVGVYVANGANADPDAPSRYDTAASTLFAAADEADTELDVVTEEGPIWTTDVAHMPFDVTLGGEVVRVTGIASGLTDDFDRVEADGWGSTTTGQAWAIQGGVAADYSVSGGVGVVDVDATGDNRLTTIATDIVGADIVARMRLPGGAEASTVETDLIVHHTPGATSNDDTQYQAALVWQSTNDLQIHIGRRSGGTFTNLTGNVDVGTYVNGQWFYCRFVVLGSNLRAKAWADGDPEPAGWNVITTDDVLESGRVGIKSRLGGSVVPPVQVQYDDVAVRNVQRFTVTRARNSITKGHNAGTDVTLYQPAVYAL